MGNDSGLVVNAQLTLRDHLDLWKASRFRRLQWIFFVIAVIYAYLAVAELVNHWNDGFDVFVVGLYSFVVLFAIFGSFAVPHIRARLLFNHSSLAKEPRRYLISSSAIRSESKLSIAEYQWGSFTRIVETKKLFCFFQSPLYALIVPKRCFSDAGDIPQLRQMLQTYFRGKLSLLTER